MTERAIRNATEEMARAGFIEEIPGRPSSFRADPEAWAPLLSGEPRAHPSPASIIPPWHAWSTVFAFLVDVLAWARTSGTDRWTSYVAGSRARDLVERHQVGLRRANVEFLVSRAVRAGATDYLRGFVGIVERVSDRAKENLSPTVVPPPPPRG